MEYDDERVRHLIERAVREEGEDCEPAFYAVSGSHLYGFPSDDGGDVDVRGVHVADGRRYCTLDEPAEQIVVNQSGTTAGYEDVAHVDLVSYELKKFGRLLLQANFNVIEVVCRAEPVLNERPEAVAELRELIAAHLPMHVPQTYYGMARTNYEGLPAPESDEQPDAKTLLYALRGVLAAEYVQQERAIEPDVRTLSEHVLGDAALVEELIAVKQHEETAQVDEALAERAREQLDVLFETVSVADERAPPSYRDGLNEWLLQTRAV